MSALPAPRDRLIVALDLPDTAAAEAMVDADRRRGHLLQGRAWSSCMAAACPLSNGW